MRIQILVAAAIVGLAVLGYPEIGQAGEWRVSPIKLYFDAKTRSDVLTVINEGTETLTLEITAMAWSQDQDGQDRYEPATDLVFFPKQLTVEPKTERVIRTGVRVPAVNREKTYRLFIREIPNRRQTDANTVAIAIQFGVPVFIKPPNVDIQGSVTDAVLDGGNFSVTVVNQGNSHFRINTVSLKGTTSSGEPVYSEDLNGWYLLNGNSRRFTATIPNEICQQLNVLDIQVKTDQVEFSGRLDVDQAMCSTP